MVQYNLKAQKGKMCMSGLSSTFDRSRVITESIQLAKSKRFCFYIAMSTVKMSEIVFSSFQHFLLDLAEQNPIKLTQPWQEDVTSLATTQIPSSIKFCHFP